MCTRAGSAKIPHVIENLRKSACLLNRDPPQYFQKIPLVSLVVVDLVHVWIRAKIQFRTEIRFLALDPCLELILSFRVLYLTVDIQRIVSVGEHKFHVIDLSIAGTAQELFLPLLFIRLFCCQQNPFDGLLAGHLSGRESVAIDDEHIGVVGDQENDYVVAARVGSLV